MNKYKIFLQWWLIFILINLGNYVLYNSGIFEKINSADITKISFIIYGFFMVSSIWCGVNTFRACKHPHHLASVHKFNETGWFVSELLFKLGMIGTVLGFIYALGISFDSINVSDASTLQNALTRMGNGMGTALYTTASGMICGILLQLQLYNLKYFLDSQ